MESAEPAPGEGHCLLAPQANPVTITLFPAVCPGHRWRGRGPPVRELRPWRVSTSIGSRRRIAPPPSSSVDLPESPESRVYLALNLARTRVRCRQSWSLAVKTNGVSGGRGTRGGIVVTRAPVERRTPLSLVDNGGHRKRVIGFEPTTFTLATCGQWVLSREVR